MSADSNHQSQFLSVAAKVTIHLIQEELKNRKFFHLLRHLGFDNRFYEADLIGLIVPGVGLSVDSPPTLAFCDQLLDRHSSRVTENDVELYDEATRVYDILLARAKAGSL